MQWCLSAVRTTQQWQRQLRTHCPNQNEHPTHAVDHVDLVHALMRRTSSSTRPLHSEESWVRTWVECEIPSSFPYETGVFESRPLRQEMIQHSVMQSRRAAPFPKPAVLRSLSGDLIGSRGDCSQFPPSRAGHGRSASRQSTGRKDLGDQSTLKDTGYSQPDLRRHLNRTTGPLIRCTSTGTNQT